MALTKGLRGTGLCILGKPQSLDERSSDFLSIEISSAATVVESFKATSGRLGIQKGFDLPFVISC